MDILSTRGGRIEMARRQSGIPSPSVFRKMLMEQKGIDIGASHWSRIESDKAGISLPLLIAVCELTGKSADWILFGKEEIVYSQKFSPEATSTASMIDDMDNGYCQSAIDMVRNLKTLNDEQRDMSDENAALLKQVSGLQSALSASVTRPASETGYIYFVAAPEAGRIKVGFSATPERRINSLMTSSAYKLETLLVIEGSREQEQAIHQRFAHLRVHREWFADCAELRDYIATLK